MQGDALSWYQWMSSNGLLHGWSQFLDALMTRFGPSLYEDYKGAPSKLVQESTVSDYQSIFEALSMKSWKVFVVTGESHQHHAQSNKNGRAMSYLKLQLRRRFQQWSCQDCC
ncbi:uncharacterized protein LOC122094175 [Macadamia integrifolia]|uniref:uncharacterized protein LOC122094175 n=1 Tax=Macadamia integrifolia TaxID=60698 RepID=UPI001C52E5B7|nr:uncharacterized protein LOC122094175 [Macadamia integrifolia]